VQDTVYQYELSTAWDISTAVIAGSPAVSEYDASAEIGVARSITFKSDGTIMYILEQNTDTIYQYTLATPWEVATASYDTKSLSYTDAADFADTLRFSCCGTRAFFHYLTGIYTYVLSTPWDISTGTYLKRELGTNPPEAGPNSIHVNQNGTKLFLLGSNETVYQYNMSTPWDINSAIYGAGGSPAETSFYVGNEDTSTLGMAIKTDGTRLYIAGNSTNTIYQYDLAVAGDISSASKTPGSPNLSELSIGSEDGTPVDLAFSADGTKMYMLGFSTGTIYQYELSTPWDIGTGTLGAGSPNTYTFDANNQDSQPYGIAFNPSGLQLFIVGLATDSVYRYTLSTAWDVSTASYDDISINLTAWDGTILDIEFSSNGFYMYFVGSLTDTVYQFALYLSLIHI